MTFGEILAMARKDAGFTQVGLAEEIGVSAEAVSKWEKDRYQPGAENMARLEEILHLSWYDESGKPRDIRIFNEVHMSAFLKGKFASGDFPEARKALPFAKEQHASSKPRKGPGNVPYIAHPLTMACHALAMGLDDDVLLAALLLHDVSEDCGVPPDELPVCREAQEIVALVTKAEKGYEAKKYFDAIAENPKACLVKCIDRCNNLSTMVNSFTPAQSARYIRETEKWYPRLLRIVKKQPEYNNAAWLLEYMIRSLLGTAKKII